LLVEGGVAGGLAGGGIGDLSLGGFELLFELCAGSLFGSPGDCDADGEDGDQRGCD